MTCDDDDDDDDDEEEEEDDDKSESDKKEEGRMEVRQYSTNAKRKRSGRLNTCSFFFITIQQRDQQKKY